MSSILYVLSLSFSSKNIIEFRYTENLNAILTYSVGPHYPGALCAVSPSILVYAYRSRNPRQLHWLDCSEAQPKPLGITANTKLPIVQDMCTAKLENETLLIIISLDANEHMHAYNSTTGQLKWSAQKKIPSGTFNSSGVTADGNGRIFVVDDTNKCIQMFSASDGQYLGCFMNKGDQGLRDVIRLRWCVSTSSLVAAHKNGTKYFISDIH